MKILNLLKNKKLLVIIGVLFIVILIALFFRKPAETPTPPPYNINPETSSKANTWNSVTPNVTPASKIPSSFGTLISKVKLDNGDYKYSYDWKGKYLPIVVITNPSDVVEFMRVPQLGEDHPTLTDFIKNNNLGTADFTMYVKGEFRVKAYVFLSKGIAVEAAEGSDFITNIRYFTPTDRATFLNNWGTDLETTYTQRGN